MDDVQMTEIVPGDSSETAEVSENMNFILANVDGCFKAYNGITPYVGLEFNSADEAFDYYNLYAKDKEFGIRKEGLDKSRKPSKEILSRTFVCNKAGVKRVDNREFGKLVNRRPDTRVNCIAGMKIKPTDSGTWVVSKFTEEHKNHSLTSPDKVLNHYSHKRMHRTKSCKDLMSKLSGQGLPPATIARVLNAASGSGDELITSQQCSDHIKTVRKNNIGIECISVIKNFQDRRATDPDFYFAMEVYNDGTMRSIFWADGRSRSTYLRLGDVVVFDVTYRTNHLSLPFAPFTGVNHHRQSTLFGCALLADEQEDTFVWLFTEWLRCMNGIAPKSIITDQDGRIVEAIRKVFPNSRHRFCGWHISKHIGEHLVPLKLQYGEQFSSYFYRWLEAKTIEQCEQNWNIIKEKYEIDENGMDWLSKTYRQRKHWVDAYMKDIFWAGMTTSQRSESINAFFDSYVNSKTQIPEFVEQYDKAIAARRASESQEDFMTLNSKPVVTLPHPIDVQASKVYTRCMLKLFQREPVDGLSLFHEEVIKEGLATVFKVGSYEENKDKWEEVIYDQNGELKVTCSCAMFETDGYLCKHILHVMHHNQIQAIPDQ